MDQLLIRKFFTRYDGQMTSYLLISYLLQLIGISSYMTSFISSVGYCYYCIGRLFISSGRVATMATRALYISIYKSSAVAEMGDRGHNRHGPKRGGGVAVHLSWELGPRLIQCGLGRGLLLYQVPSSSIQPLATIIDMGKKLGGGRLGVHLRQSRLDRGLPPCQMAS